MRVVGCLSLLLASLAATHGGAQESEPITWAPPEPTVDDGPRARFTLVEEFTADTLTEGEVRIGTDVDLGLGDDVMIGTDVVALAVGATSLQAKARIYQRGAHRVSLGVRAAYLSQSTLLWGSVNEHFEELEARIVRPQIAWTNEVSPRLRLHTFWAKGFGTIDARLSDKGRRKLWETKHPGADYEQRDKQTQKPADQTDSTVDEQAANPEGESTTNQEKASAKQSALTSRSIQVQSITGLAQERFQLTGEFSRTSGNKVLVTTRMEQTTFMDLKSNFLRLTVAHQWIWTSFQMRLGVGLQYYVMSGRDLDDEQINESGVQPASDIAFYWRF